MEVYKYPFQIDDTVMLRLPVGCRFLHWGKDPKDNLCVWVLADPSAELTYQSFYVRGTGQTVPPDAEWKQLIVDGPFVWHIFA